MEIITRRNSILSKVKTYINEFLDPNKSTYIPDKTIDDILFLLDITSRNYYEALSIASGSDYEIHYKRNPDSCFVNNYKPSNSEGLESKH